MGLSAVPVEFVNERDGCLCVLGALRLSGEPLPALAWHQIYAHLAPQLAWHLSARRTPKHSLPPAVLAP